MSSKSQPATPLRVPKAATIYTPTTQDPDLRSQINSQLLRDGHIRKIESVLQHALHAHPSNWPSKVSQHALTLLRSGECSTFPRLMERVLADIRRDTEAEASAAAQPRGPAAATATATGASSSKAHGPAAKGKAVNGVAAAGGGGSMANGTGNVAAGGSTGLGLAMPKTVVEEGVRITRECLELVCEIEE